MLKLIQKALCVCILLSLILSPFPELALCLPLLNPSSGWTRVARAPGLGETGRLASSVALQDLGQLLSLPGVGAYFFRPHRTSEGNQVWEAIWSPPHPRLLMMPRERIPLSKCFRIINCLAVGDTKGLEGSHTPGISCIYMSADA